MLSSTPNVAAWRTVPDIIGSSERKIRTLSHGFHVENQESLNTGNPKIPTDARNCACKEDHTRSFETLPGHSFRLARVRCVSVDSIRGVSTNDGVCCWSRCPRLRSFVDARSAVNFSRGPRLQHFSGSFRCSRSTHNQSRFSVVLIPFTFSSL